MTYVIMKAKTKGTLHLLLSSFLLSFGGGVRKAECAFPHPLFLFCQIFFKKVLTSRLECGIMSPVPIEKHGSIAQLGEHLPYKQRVIGSSPIVPTKGM